LLVGGRAAGGEPLPDLHERGADVFEPAAQHAGGDGIIVHVLPGFGADLYNPAVFHNQHTLAVGHVNL
jgi:hypothetical protein